MSSTVKVFFQAVGFGIEDGTQLTSRESFPVNKGTELLRTISVKPVEKSFNYDPHMHFHAVATSNLPLAKWIKTQDHRYAQATIIEYGGECYLAPVNYNNAVERLAKCNGVAADLRV